MKSIWRMRALIGMIMTLARLMRIRVNAEFSISSNLKSCKLSVLIEKVTEARLLVSEHIQSSIRKFLVRIKR